MWTKPVVDVIVGCHLEMSFVETLFHEEAMQENAFKNVVNFMAGNTFLVKQICGNVQNFLSIVFIIIYILFHVNIHPKSLFPEKRTNHHHRFLF
jgi:hypothetical protein